MVIWTVVASMAQPRLFATTHSRNAGEVERKLSNLVALFDPIPMANLAVADWDVPVLHDDGIRNKRSRSWGGRDRATYAAI